MFDFLVFAMTMEHRVENASVNTQPAIEKNGGSERKVTKESHVLKSPPSH